MDPPADVWLPLQADPSTENHISRVRVAARLKPGVTVAEAQKDVGETMEPLLRKYAPHSPAEAPILLMEQFTAIPLRDAMVGDVRPALYLLIGAVGFVLLISCANAANLLLARGARAGARDRHTGGAGRAAQADRPPVADRKRDSFARRRTFWDSRWATLGVREIAGRQPGGYPDASGPTAPPSR